jgi:hypothetical protein
MELVNLVCTYVSAMRTNTAYVQQRLCLLDVRGK